ncbi:DUF485 domain-containing protein [Ectobacillus sp. sgz5001026]|uniref:DUF485 domain-containing protein n=1 Tax=Ectobacillus sp. sgz5001026 TaxID=3242473 RepID=UPI0036D40189
MAVKKEFQEEINENDYTRVAASREFKQLLQVKKKFIVPITLFFLSFYFLLPILTSYSKILNTSAVGAITWAWIFAFAQFIMTWALCIVYSKKARTFDRLSEKIVKQLDDGRDTQ